MTPLLLALALSTPSLDDRPASALDGRDDRGSVLHPDIPLRDRDGALLRDSGGVLHFGQTCGGCHDVGYIEDHAYHLRPGESAGGAPPPRSRYDEGRGLAARFAPLVYGDPRGGLGRDPAAAHRALGPRAAGDAPSAELNCLSCHGSERARVARRDALATARHAVPNRQLLALGVAEATDDGWAFPALDAEGAVPAARLGLGASRSAACGDCHAPTPRRSPFVAGPGRPTRAEATGFVYGGQLLADSGLNLAGKASLDRPFDVHAERLLECGSCHFSVNDPAFRSEGDRGPTHLRFDGRREAPSRFLKRPSHHLATGATPQRVIGEEVDGSMRVCAGCHDAPAAHRSLPSSGRHLDVLACESCHLPAPAVPLLSAVDWSLPDPDGAPRAGYRGVAGPPKDAASLITGARLVWARSRGASGKVAPHNLVAHAFWVGGEPERPLAMEVVRRALRTPAGALSPELAELGVDARLDSEDAVARAAGLLRAAGVTAPRLVAEVHPYSVHHGVAPASAARAACEGCHSGRGDHPLAPIRLAADLPPGIEVAPVAGIEGGRLAAGADTGATTLRWIPSADALAIHLFGRSRTAWVDALGLGLVLLTLLAAALHGLLRLRAKRGPHP